MVASKDKKAFRGFLLLASIFVDVSFVPFFFEMRFPPMSIMQNTIVVFCITLMAYTDACSY